MEILSKPWEGPGWQSDAECQRCGVKVRVDATDIKHARFKVDGFWYNHSAVVETRYYFVCPECEAEVLIGDGSDLPAWVKYRSIDTDAK